jgi:predicted alpha/beta hydrolase family esterase
VSALDAAVRDAAEPSVLAAHSLACSLVGHFAQTPGASRVRGAFLVGPSDIEAPTYPKGPVGFEPMPMARLPFPSIVVASTNDQYVSLDRARAFAEAWGSRLVIIGEAGHINGASGYGPWPEGKAMLLEFCRELEG